MSTFKHNFRVKATIKINNSLLRTDENVVAFSEPQAIFLLEKKYTGKVLDHEAFDLGIHVPDGMKFECGQLVSEDQLSLFDI